MKSRSLGTLMTVWSKPKVTYPPYPPKETSLLALPEIDCSTFMRMLSSVSPSTYSGISLINCPGAGLYSSTRDIYRLYSTNSCTTFTVKL